MPAIKVKHGMFAGSGQLYGKGGLDSLIRGIAVDNARLKVEITGIADLVDNSTGVAGSVQDLNDHPTAFDASTSGGASGADFATAVNKAADLQKVLCNSINGARTLLGLPLLSATDGTQATANTLPALSKTVGSASGTAVPKVASARGTMSALKHNQRKIHRALNEVLIALGQRPAKSPWKGTVHSDFILQVKGTLTATTDGKNSVSKAAVDAFFTQLANNYATMAASWNAVMTQTSANMPLSVVAG